MTTDINICVGDIISFMYSGELISGRVSQVTNHGYWIPRTAGVYGSGCVRCAKDKIVRINKTIH